jgi:arsenite methyltransferase
VTDQADDLKLQVRERYARAATAVGEGCCGPVGTLDAGAAHQVASSCCAPSGPQAVELFGAGLYDATDVAELPAEAVEASLGCGNPLLVAELREGDVVLDLGSGGGIDVLLSARRVGTTGFAYGVDMTPEMLDLARANATKAGATNVEFREGSIEDLPFDDGEIDVIISNCVINLSVDKPAVLREAFRVLRPGGRFGVSDVVAEDHLSAADRAARGSYVGCIAGALSRSEYLELLEAAGFANASVTFTHQVADGLHGAIVRAERPA